MFRKRMRGDDAGDDDDPDEKKTKSSKAKKGMEMAIHNNPTTQR